MESTKAGDMPVLSVGDRRIGPGHPCFIVAEIGMNHVGDPDVARAFIDEAGGCGVDAVKFQTIDPGEMYPPDHPRFKVMQRRAWRPEVYADLMEHARKKGMVFFSTPFDGPSADLLEGVGVPLFKVGSGELTHLAFLRHLARKGRPIVLSTGVAGLPEIEYAVRTILETGNGQLALLHCVSMYPTPVEKANVRALLTLRERFHLPVGVSDHTLSAPAALAAVALGACIVEKHFSLSRTLPDGDNDISFVPSEMTALVQAVREVEAALGTGEKAVLPEEEGLRPKIRRGLYARRDIAQGEILQPDMVLARRPGAEIPAEAFDRVVGRTAEKDIDAQAPLRWADLSEGT